MKTIVILVVVLIITTSAIAAEEQVLVLKAANVYYQTQEQIDKFKQLSFDECYNRISNLLYKKRPTKLVVRLYRNQFELSNVFAAITGKHITAPGFYSNGVIYLNMQNITKSVLIHEIAHSLGLEEESMCRMIEGTFVK